MKIQFFVNLIIFCCLNVKAQNDLRFIKYIKFSDTNNTNILKIFPLESGDIGVISNYPTQQVDSFHIVNISSGTKKDSYLIPKIDKKIKDFSVLNDKLFLLYYGGIEIFILSNNGYKLFSRVEIGSKDRNKIFNLWPKTEIELYLTSSKSYEKYKDEYLNCRIIKYETGTGKHSITKLYSQPDSLGFLGLYSPNWLINVSPQGRLGLIDYEGNLKIFDERYIQFSGKIDTIQIDKNIKKDVLGLFSNYMRDPSIETLNKLDSVTLNLRKFAGIQLNSRYILTTVQSIDTGVIPTNSLPLIYEHYIFEYSLDKESNRINLKQIKSYFERVNPDAKRLTNNPIHYIHIIPQHPFTILDNKLIIADVNTISDFLNNDDYQVKSLSEYRKSIPKKLGTQVNINSLYIFEISGED